MVDLSRRAMLLGGAGALALAAGGVAVLWPDGRSLPSSVPHVAPGHVESGSFSSAAMRTTVGWSVAFPPGHTDEKLPVLLALHGRGEDHRFAFDDMFMQYFLADTDGPRFAIASVDGGDHDYWHPRAFGDPAGMVLDEFLPLLTHRGLDTDRLALLGWSMGGYGALYLGGVLGPSRVRAVVAASPAIWHSAPETPAGAFDDAADFAEHSIFDNLDRLTGLSLRIDCGDADGFAPATRDLRAALTPTPAGGIEPGEHDATYWRTQGAAQLAFVADRL